MQRRIEPEADELFRLGTKGMRPGKVVLLGSLAWMQLTSHSVCTLPRAHMNVTNPSSHAVMAPSLLSSSLTRAWSYSRSSMTTIDVDTVPKGEEGLHQSRSGDQHYDKK
jgi:hypothetical protein